MAFGSDSMHLALRVMRHSALQLVPGVHFPLEEEEGDGVVQGEFNPPPSPEHGDEESCMSRLSIHY